MFIGKIRRNRPAEAEIAACRTLELCRLWRISGFTAVFGGLTLRENFARQPPSPYTITGGSSPSRFLSGMNLERSWARECTFKAA